MGPLHFPGMRAPVSTALLALVCKSPSAALAFGGLGLAILPGCVKDRACGELGVTSEAELLVLRELAEVTRAVELPFQGW